MSYWASSIELEGAQYLRDALCGAFLAGARCVNRITPAPKWGHADEMDEHEMNGGEAHKDVSVQQAQSSGVAVLDQSLWSQFHEAETAEAFVRAWLGLQCRNISGAVASVVVLGEPDTGPFTPVSVWPRADDDVSAGLMQAANEAISKRQSIVDRKSVV